ncbi:hypothetical protein [Bacillus thuringiensis]|uniref:hypothetical protein n=1 Tax=Bacillus thuringiensis TaxID=1428 RepID=UPI00345A9890
MNAADCLFTSKKTKKIAMIRTFRILNVVEKIGFDKIGTYTLRKNIGMSLLSKNMVMLLKVFNHSVLSITLYYIEIQKGDV